GGVVVEKEGVALVGNKLIDRTGDDARLDRTKKGGRPIDAIEQANEDAFFAAHAEPAQDVAEALDPVGEIAIAVFAAMIDESDLVAAPGLEIALQDVDGEVVVARHGGCAWQLVPWCGARLNAIHRFCIRFLAGQFVPEVPFLAAIMPMVQRPAIR